MLRVLGLSVFAAALVLRAWLLRRSEPERTGRPSSRHRGQDLPSLHQGFQPPKPLWVRQEVFRLKAWMRQAGCRTLALTFNHLHGQRRGMTVGKTFVASVLRERGEEVMRLRRKLRRRRARWFGRNVMWGLDWTFVPDVGGDPQAILGVIDCGSRACLELAPVESRRTVTVLRQLLQLFERFGTPKVLRTDNDSAFRSVVFRGVLRLLGVRHSRTAPFAPWQNGRVERLFGTVKAVLRGRAARGGATAVSERELRLIRTWYNHLRPHQGLDGLTPAEAWSGQKVDRRRRPAWVSAWGGVLSGYYCPQ